MRYLLFVGSISSDDDEEFISNREFPTGERSGPFARLPFTRYLYSVIL